MPRKYSRRPSQKAKRTTKRQKSKKMCGGVTRKLTRRKVADSGVLNTKTLTPYTKYKLEKLDRHVYQSPNFIEQQQEKIDNNPTHKNHPKFMCGTIEEKYEFLGKWLKSFLNKFQANNPDMNIYVEWKDSQDNGIKITNNQHIQVFKKRILERTSVAKLFLKFIAQGKVSMEGGQFDGTDNGEDVYMPIYVVNNFDYSNGFLELLNATLRDGEEDFEVTHYSIYIPGSPHRFSINYLNIDNIENDIHIIKQGINVLKNQIGRTCSIRSTRMNMF